MRKLWDTVDEILEWGGIKKQVILLVLSGVALLFSVFWPLALPFEAAWIAIVLCGLPIVIEAIMGLLTEFDIRAGALVSIALIASVCTGELFAAGEVAFIMQFGELLEHLTVARARAGIEKLVRLMPQTARVLRENAEMVIPAEQVRVGDVVRVLPGETVPVDGIIVYGQTSINQAVMTGESLPVDKTVGDEVSSGTANQFGAFDMRAVRVGEDSSIRRMIQLVQSADAGKAKIVGVADKWATWIVMIALVAAGLAWIFSGEIIRAVTILVVFCPCALVLATPTAIMAAIGNAAKHGFLVREGDALERLAGVSRVAFDKTGTLTHGTPTVSAVHSVSSAMSTEELYRLAASAEQLSEHPLGKAVVSYARSVEMVLASVEEFRMLPGEGVTALVDGRRVAAGNVKLLATCGVTLPDEVICETETCRYTGCTVIYVAVDGVLAGYLVLTDTVREESAAMIRELRTLGVRPALLTGDNPQAASAIGGRLRIDEIHADCLPEDKLRIIEAYQAAGDAVCMIGDGVNDAPSLKTAAVGIAMGGVGSDIAVDAADIALVDDEVKQLPHLLRLSRRMMKTIKLNIIFSMGLNFLAIGLASTGLLGPVAGALLHNGGSVAVIINSAILLKWKKRS